MHLELVIVGYPYTSLKLIEVPHYHSFGGKAFAGIVELNENLFLQNYQDGATTNNVAPNTIHEVAHQWFGKAMQASLMTHNLRRYQSGRAFAHQDQASLLNLEQQESIARLRASLI